MTGRPAAGRARRWALAALLLGALLGGLGASPAVGQAPPAPSPVGEVALALGDSLAVGVGASSPGQRGYVGLLQGWLARTGPTGGPALRTLAVSGETSQTFIEGGQLGRAQEVLRQARADGRRVSPVTLSLGGNDLLRLDGQPPAERQAGLDRFRRNLALVLDRLVEGLTADGQRTGALALLTVYNPRGGDATVAGSDAWWIEQFNGALREAAAARGLLLVDAWALLAGQERAWTHIGVGDIHPTNTGHAAIAEAIWRSLRADAAPPAVEIVAPAGGDLARPVPTVRARASDSIGVARVELWVGGQRVKPLTWLPDLGLYAATWDGRAAAPGPHRLEVRATDAAGNVGSAVVEVRAK